MQRFIMAVGLPASGKSTWARKYAEDHHNFVIVSSDEIRALLGDVNDQSKNTEVFEIMQRQTNAALENGYDVIWDATNVSSKHRIGALKQLPKNISINKICIIFFTPVWTCKKLNQDRDRQVPEEVINKMVLNWQTPWYFEGWNEIRVNLSFLELLSVDDYIDDTFCFNQRNKHHAEPLHLHLNRTASILANISPILATAGMLHDWGKLETQVFVDSNGEISPEAHYYHHENVGAYKSLFYLGQGLDYIEMIHVSALITWHMLPFSWETSQDHKKAKEKFGEQFYNELIELHYADMEASQDVFDG